MPTPVPKSEGIDPSGMPKPIPGQTPVGDGGDSNALKNKKSPSLGGRPTGALEQPPQQQEKPPTPEEKLDTDTIKQLKLKIEKGIKERKIQDINDIVPYLMKYEGWDKEADKDRIEELKRSVDIETDDEFFIKLLKGDLDQEDTSEAQPPAGPAGGPPIGGAPPAPPSPGGPPPSGPQGGPGAPPIGGLPPVGAPPKISSYNKNKDFKRGVDHNKNYTTGSISMGKKVLLKDGVLVEASADTTDARPVLSNLYNAIKTVEASADKLIDTKLRVAALDMLEEDSDDDSGKGFGMGLGKDSDKGFGLGLGKDSGGGKDSAIQKAIESLEKALDALEGAVGEAKDTDMDLDDTMKKDSLLEEKAPKALDKADKAMGFEPKPKKNTLADEITTASAKEDRKAKGDKSSQKAMDIAMGKGSKKEESSEESKEKKMDKKSALEIVDKIRDKIAEMEDEENRDEKEANLYPFKDLNKTQVEDTNRQTAKDQKSTIDSEIKKQPATDKKDEHISPKGIQDNGLNPSYEDGAKKTVDVKTAEKLRLHSIRNAVDKARLSVELAAQQQLKGLIDNPLYSSMVNNMVDVGMTKEAAEAVAFNSMIDGYEPAQTLIIKEAFDTFMNQSVEDFVKVAKFTKDSGFIKEASEEEQSPVKEANTQENREEKTASTSPALRGSQASGDEGKKSVYKNYWTQVADERRRW